MTSDPGKPSDVEAALAEIGDHTDATSDLERAYLQGFQDGLRKGRTEGGKHALIADGEERVVEFAENHFGDGTVVRLLDNGDLYIVAAAVASLDAQMAFMGDLRDCIGDTDVFAYVTTPDASKTAIDRIAVESGRVLKA
jgi:hypothetical protein